MCDLYKQHVSVEMMYSLCSEILPIVPDSRVDLRSLRLADARTVLRRDSSDTNEFREHIRVEMVRNASKSQAF